MRDVGDDKLPLAASPWNGNSAVSWNVPLIRRSVAGNLDGARPILIDQSGIQLCAVTYQKQVRVAQQRIKLDHVRHIEAAKRMNKIYVVARPPRWTDLRQVRGNELVDLVQLKRHQGQQTQYRCGSAERDQLRVRRRPLAHSASS